MLFRSVSQSRYPTSIKEEKGSLVDDEDTHRAFGRWSSSKSIILPFGPGNLQNIPMKARKIFSWSSNNSDEIWIVSADYVQAEAVKKTDRNNKYAKQYQDAIDYAYKYFGWEHEKGER